MPLKRPTRKPAARKPRMVRRRKPRVARNLSLRPIHNFTRDVQFSVLNGALADPYFERQFWKLDDLGTALSGAYTDFTNLFDEYRINSVTVIWRLEVDPSAQTATGAVYPRLTTYKDYNDTAIPANVDEVRQRQAKQIATMYPGKNIVRKIRPAVQTAVLKSPSGVTVNAPKWNQWLPCSVVDVQHIGFKYMIERWNNANYTINVLYRYHISCRMVR